MTLHAHSRAGERDLVQALLEQRADPNAAASEAAVLDAASVHPRAFRIGDTALLCAIRGHHIDVVDTLLQDPRCDPCAPTQAGARPLAIAVQEDFRAGVGRLLRHGVDANGCSQDGQERTALHKAAAWHRPQCAQLLLEAHAAVDQQDIQGCTALSLACQGRGEDRHEDGQGRIGVVRLLLAHGANVNHVVRYSEGEACSPLHEATQYNHPDLIRILAASGAQVDFRTAPESGTPLHYAACLRFNEAACALLEAGADPNVVWTIKKKGWTTSYYSEGTLGVDDTPIRIAYRTDNPELCAALVEHGADAAGIFGRLGALCMTGRAHAAQALLRSDRTCAEEQSAEGIVVSPAVRMCLEHTTCPSGSKALSKLHYPSLCDTFLVASDEGMPPPLFFAVELGHHKMLRRVLSDMIHDATHQKAILEAASRALTEHDATADCYVPGARYHGMLLGLLDAGLVDLHKCDAIKRLLAAYLGSIGCTAYLSRQPGAFAALKCVCEARLSAIAGPLERLYEEERLGDRLHRLGEAVLGCTVALDDPGLLPMPAWIGGYQYKGELTSTAYEDYLIHLIWLVSLALDSLFADRLVKALAGLGDRVQEEDDGATVRVSSGGRPVVDVLRAPVKTVSRMQNKLASPEDHAGKARPRPKWNVDTVRAGLVVHAVEDMPRVYDAVDRGVGRMLRGKNAFRREAEVSYGYRAFLGNLVFESGLTVRQVFGGDQRRHWSDLGKRLNATDMAASQRMEVLLTALLAEDKDPPASEANAGVPESPLNIAAEVQLVYVPYLTQGRKLSHLPYKVVRCSTASELARDAGGKRTAVKKRHQPRNTIICRIRTQAEMTADLLEATERCARIAEQVVALGAPKDKAARARRGRARKRHSDPPAPQRPASTRVATSGSHTARTVPQRR